MKITSEQKPFVPITITLESKDEAEAMLVILRSIGGSPINSRRKYFEGQDMKLQNLLGLTDNQARELSDQLLSKPGPGSTNSIYFDDHTL